MTALNELGIEALAEVLDAGDVTAEEVLEACLGHIAVTADLNTFIHVNEDGAREAARASDERRRAGTTKGPLDGVPIALKDNHVTRDIPTTAGSRILDGWRPPYDATVVRRLEEAGAVMVGKTNLDEFAMGSSNEHSAFGPVKNPWDRTRVPGGSSGGSAAAVAARQVAGSLGTDTGGSIRQPASLCGVYGLKPTYGRVSRHGIVAFASSLDQVGPFARSTGDLALLLQAIAGEDPLDSTSAPEPVEDYVAACDQGVEGLKVGLPQEYFAEGLDADVQARVQAVAEALEDAGAKVCEVSLPHTQYALSAYYLIATAEASSNLARYDGVRYGSRVEDNDLARMICRSRNQGFGSEVQRRIVLGTYVLSAGYYDAYYGRAQKLRTRIRQDFEAAFEGVDVLLTPTSPTTAFPLGARTTDPLEMYLGDVYTLAVNLAGVPAASIPAGHGEDGMPVGAQLIGPWFGEGRLLAAARSVEQRTDHHRKRPEV